MAKKEATEKWVLMTELNGEPLLHHFKLSNFGRVVKIKRGVGPEETFEPKEIGGYKYISFTTKNGSRETIYLHRLVAEFFVRSTKPEHEFVIHTDYDRRNNRFDNLKWVSKEVLYKHRAAKAGRLPGKTNSRKKLLRPDGTSNENEASSTAKMQKMISEYLGILQ